MADVSDASDASVSSTSTALTPPQTTELPSLWRRIALGVVLLLSIFMNFFQLGQNGYGNLFYAAGIRSMLDSWHNFFFASFDPGGFVTIDKPPVGFWLQTLSSKIFGFTPFSIFLPQALCGVAAVLLLYYLIKRHFGATAGLVAALVLAVTPISVVTNRNNTIDSTLALVLLLAAWTVIRASETGKLRWLLFTAVFVGLGFNVKMSEAYLALPALALAYFFCAPRKIWTRIWHLVVFALVMVVISFSWAATVDAIPAADRPYVGSTQDNSEISLAIGYNGLNRLHIGGTNLGGNRNRSSTGTNSTTRNSFTGINANGPTNGNPNGSGSNGGFGNGNRGFGGNGTQGPAAFGRGGYGGGSNLLALITGTGMGGQIGWLLPFALLGVLALAWQRRFHFQRDHQQLSLVLWGIWLIVMAVFFSINGATHEYYMTEMSPGLAACSGFGLVMMWQDYRRPGWRGWLLPIALGITAVVQIRLLSGYPTWSAWMSPLIGVLTAVAILALIFFRIRPQVTLNQNIFRLAGAATLIGLLALVIAPTVWSGYAVIKNTESSNPLAGPTAQGSFGGSFTAGRAFHATSTNGNGANTAAVDQLRQLAGAFGIGGDALQTNKTLISYLKTKQGNTRFLVAVPSSQTADSIILTTNKPVMAMGGFNGSDPILTTSSLQSLIQNDSVHYFLINSASSARNIVNQLPEQYRNAIGRYAGGFGGFGRGGNSATLNTWIEGHCTLVPTSQWGGSTGGSAIGGNALYNCANTHS
ncbi:dolichyl-phosphate-mannose--protein mannosyltransferase [Ktedonobacteria bacterium brp13]|nr:dolichyl-phosphate-mannose--protein mannosyltransferase [Ktedonobacteria bacterium brp13]